VLSWYVAQVFSQGFWDGSSCPLLLLVSIIIIIIFINYELTAVYLFSNSTFVTDQTPLIHRSANSCLTVRHMLSITAFFIRMYSAGRRLCSFKLSCNLFGIIPAVGSTCGVVEAVCSCSNVTSSCFQSVCFWSFTVTMLWEVWLLGIAASVDCASVVVLSSMNCYVSVTVQFVVWVLLHGLRLVFAIRHSWSVWQSTFCGQFVVDSFGHLIVTMGIISLSKCTACTGYMVNGHYCSTAAAAATTTTTTTTTILSLITGHFSLALLLFNQRWSPLLRLPVSDCSTSRIMCDVPSTAAFCSESI
jgi:hypothetical protein